jgi:hypothetical protein
MAYSKRNPNGQATMANSEPVVIASNQTAIPVTQSGTWDEIGINDSGNSITVDAVNLDIRDLVNTDVVTAELSATDNAVLDAIASSVASIDTDTSTIIGHVDGIEALIGTTNTTLTTIDGRVDGLETLVTSTNTKLDTVNTNLTTIDGRVDGLETSNSAIQTSVQLLDDAIIADDAAFTPAVTKVSMSGFEFDDSGTDSIDEGDAGAARISGNRNQYIQIRDGAGNERGANVNASNQLSVVEANSAAIQTAVQLIDDTVYVAGTDTQKLPARDSCILQ